MEAAESCSVLYPAAWRHTTIPQSYPLFQKDLPWFQRNVHRWLYVSQELAGGAVSARVVADSRLRPLGATGAGGNRQSRAANSLFRSSQKKAQHTRAIASFGLGSLDAIGRSGLDLVLGLISSGLAGSILMATSAQALFDSRLICTYSQFHSPSSLEKPWMPRRFALGFLVWWSPPGCDAGGSAADPLGDMAPSGTVANVPNQEWSRGTPSNRLSGTGGAGEQLVFSQEKRGVQRSPIEARRRVSWRCLAISDTTPHRKPA